MELLSRSPACTFSYMRTCTLHSLQVEQLQRDKAVLNAHMKHEGMQTEEVSLLDHALNCMLMMLDFMICLNVLVC